MTSRLKSILAIAVVQICTIHANSQATIITNDAAIVSSFGDTHLVLTTTNSMPFGSGLFAISITPSGDFLFTFQYSGIAEEYALYAVVFGTVIDPSFATATIPLVSNNGIDPGSSVQIFFLGQSRYFGYWDDRTPQPGGNGTPGNNDNYGWVLITRTASGLEVTSSATAIGGGIIAGTLTPAPEPSAMALTLLGLSLFLRSRRLGLVFAR